MTDDIWEQFADEDDDKYQRWEKIGAEVEGVVVNVGVGSYLGGDAYPELTVRRADDKIKIVSASQSNLKRQLIELRPKVGDRLRIVFRAEGAARQGFNPVKLFDVAVEPGPAPAEQPVADDLA